MEIFLFQQMIINVINVEELLVIYLNYLNIVIPTTFLRFVAVAKTCLNMAN